MECATQKKPTYEITNSMRSIAPPMMQAQPSPIAPSYARNSPVVPYQEAPPPAGTISPVEASPSAESKVNSKKSASKKSIELEGSREKEKDGGIMCGKGGGGEGGGGGEEEGGGGGGGEGGSAGLGGG
uniref:Uncharacterized protein n=1 Tax=Elaeophora elaphi TaxID=1147741 RepID=A0A0R3RND5_9BILA